MINAMVVLQVNSAMIQCSSIALMYQNYMELSNWADVASAETDTVGY